MKRNAYWLCGAGRGGAGPAEKKVELPDTATYILRDDSVPGAASQERLIITCSRALLSQSLKPPPSQRVHPCPKTAALCIFFLILKIITMFSRHIKLRFLTDKVRGRLLNI